MSAAKQFPTTPAPQATSRTGLIFAFVLIIVSIAAGVPIAKILTAPKPTATSNTNIRLNNPNATTAIPKDMRRYESGILGMTLLYPSGWQRVSDETRERFEGADGFFQIVAIPSSIGSIDDAALNETKRTPALFGSQPQVNKNQLRGLAVRTIFPSPDQNPELGGMVGLVIEMPRPVIVKNTSYPYLVLYADRAHMEAIGSSLAFDLNTTK